MTHSAALQFVNVQKMSRVFSGEHLNIALRYFLLQEGHHLVRLDGGNTATDQSWEAAVVVQNIGSGPFLDERR